jgi:dihydrofolate reductase
MIVATDIHQGIGKDGSLPWSIPEDLRHFAKLTKGSGKNAVLMGRKTYQSIGRPLPKRFNIVLSSQADVFNHRKSETENIIFVNGDDQQEIKTHCREKNIEELWVIGGASVYSAYFAKVSELYVTEIQEEYHCDTFFMLHCNYKEAFKKSVILNTGYTNNGKLIEYKKYFN